MLSHYLVARAAMYSSCFATSQGRSLAARRKRRMRIRCGNANNFAILQTNRLATSQATVPLIHCRLVANTPP